MKPLKIELQNFGPYEKQIIDFSRFEGAPLFLISGKTGSGKTTIFDAMCYALFGKTSGMDRQPEQMRSGFAQATQKTCVRFTFSHQNKVYLIERQPRQRLAKKRGQGTTERKMEACLKFKDNAGKEKELAKVGAINTFIQELLSLTPEQFTQIIMLPQGKFRSFLEADSNEKERLLRDLFGTEIFKLWADDLQKHAKQFFYENEKRRTQIDILKKQVEEVDQELELPDWLPAMESYLKGITVKAKAAEKALLQQDKLLARAQQHYEGQKQLQVEIQELHELRQLLTQKYQPQEDTQKKKIIAQLVEVQKIEPLFVQQEDLQETLRETQAKLVTNENNQTALQIKLDEQLKNEKELMKQQTEMEKLQHKVNLYTEKVPLYEKAARLKADLLECQHMQRQLTAKKVTYEKKEQQIAAEIEAQKQKIVNEAELSQQALQLQKQVHELERGAELLKSQRTKEAEFTELQQTLHVKQVELTQLAAAEKAANQVYERLDNDFALTQIERLRQHLLPGAPCPVCGSKTHPAPVLNAVKQVSENEVKDAEKNVKQILAQKGQLEGKLTAMNKRLVELKAELRTVSQKLQRLFPAADLKNSSLTAALLTKKEKALHAAQSVFKRNKTENQQASLQITNLHAELKELQITLNAVVQNLQATEIECAKGKVKLEQAIAQLPSELTSLKDLEEFLTLQREKLTKFKVRREHTHSVIEDLEGTRTLLLSMEKEYQRNLQALQEKGKQTAAKIAQKSAQHLADLSPAQLTERRHQLPQLANLQTEFAARAAEILKLRVKIEQLETRTAAQVPRLVQSKTEYEAAGKKRQELLLEYSSANQRKETAQKNFAAVEHHWIKYQEQLQTEADWNQLVEVIGGKGRVKLGLERYVLRSYLKRVLQVANQRLFTLTSGRYRLELAQENGSYATNTGLELNIFDDDLGKVRSVHTLSGGESFIAALCLALALAEVVQRAHGGTQIEALFIDEGFGALDDDALQTALEALQTLDAQHRLIGIISHVSALRAQIPDQLRISSHFGRSQVHYVADFEEIAD